MPITVEPYNPEWPHQFAQIEHDLKDSLAEVEYVSIEHVGSTSVPGLAAKPILDIDIIATKEQLEPVVSALQKNGGYLYMGELGISDRHAFRSPLQSPTRNLYVCIQDSAALRNHVAVRDLLRRDEDLRKAYGDLKLSLGQANIEIHEYMARKSDVVSRLLELSGGVGKEELENIRRANRKGERLAPVRTERLLLREFIAGDLEGLRELLLESINEEVVQRHNPDPSHTIEEAEKMIVEIIQDAGKVPREHVELAVFLVHDPSHETEPIDPTFVGRVGAKISWLSNSHCDAKISGLGSTTSNPSLKQRVISLYCLFKPAFQRQGCDIEAMRAFFPLLLMKPAAKYGEPTVKTTLKIESFAADSATEKLADKLGFAKIKNKTPEAEGSSVYQMEG